MVEKYINLLKTSCSLSVTTLDALTITLSLSSYFVFRLNKPKSKTNAQNGTNLISNFAGIDDNSTS